MSGETFFVVVWDVGGERLFDRRHGSCLVEKCIFQKSKLNDTGDLGDLNLLSSKYFMYLRIYPLFTNRTLVARCSRFPVEKSEWVMTRQCLLGNLSISARRDMYATSYHDEESFKKLTGPGVKMSRFYWG